MKRTAGALLLLLGLGGVGCVSTDPASNPPGEFMGNYWAAQKGGMSCGDQGPRTVPGFQNPYGQPVPMAAPYNAQPPRSVAEVHDMLRQNQPLDAVQQAGFFGDEGGILQAQAGMPPGVGPPPGAMVPGGLSPPGVPPVPGMPGAFSGPVPPVSARVPGVVAAVGALTGHGGGPFPVQRTEVYFTTPLDMKVAWYAPAPQGGAGFTSSSIDVPGRYNFAQGNIYRLKLTNMPNRPELELYPTLEVVPANNKTTAFLAHSAVPVSFTDEDFEQVAAGNYVVKVIYLPDPQFQNLATTGPDEVVSSRLEPGADPIAEACRRGSILLVVRLGNIHLELPHTPAMDAPSPYLQNHGFGPGMGVLPGGMPGGMPPGMGPMPQMMPGAAGMPGGMPGGGMPGGMAGVPGLGLPPGGPGVPMIGPGMPMMGGPGTPVLQGPGLPGSGGAIPSAPPGFPPGGVLMSPTGPSAGTPPVGPTGPATGVPGGLPALPGTTPLPTAPTSQPGTGSPSLPVSRLPDVAPVQPVNAQTSPTPPPGWGGLFRK
jgi:hypothetical protein